MLCRPLFVPLPFVHIVGGALVELTKAHNWEQIGTMTPARATEIMADMLLGWYEEDCGMNCDELKACLYGTGSQFRVDPTTGNLERSDDGGATWQTDTSHDPRFISPVLAMDTADCNTAVLIVGQVQQIVDQLKDVIAVAGGIAGLVGVLTSTIAAILSAGAALPLVVALGGATLGFSTAAIDAALTADVWERLMCNIQCVTLGATQITASMWEAIKARIVEDETGVAETILWNVVNFMGPAGIQNAVAMGVEGAFLPADCEDCNCAGEWCYEWDFTASNGGWTIATDVNGARATYVAGQGYKTRLSGPGPNRVNNVFLNVSLGTSRITGVEVDYSVANFLPKTENYIVPGWPGNNAPIPQDGTGTAARYDLDLGAADLSQIYWDFLSGNTVMEITISRFRLIGDGGNPFGEDNC